MTSIRKSNRGTFPGVSENDTPPTDPYGFPDDLKQLQVQLHQARAEHQELCRTLPWSVEPMPGWEASVHPITKAILAPAREPSPGYTPEQLAEDTRLRALVQDLSVDVVTHAFWGTLERGPELIKARTALQSHPAVLDALGQPAPAAEAA